MYNVIKFQAPFERLKQYNFSSETMLYKAVITQAVIDATNISKMPRDRLMEKDAKNWILGNGDYFQKICYLAGIEPGFVIKITKEAINLNYAKLGINSKKLKTTVFNNSRFNLAKKKVI